MNFISYFERTSNDAKAPEILLANPYLGAFGNREVVAPSAAGV